MLSRTWCFLSFLFILNGCCRQQDLNLSPALHAWAPYAGAQVLTFINAAGDTMVFKTDVSRFNQSGTDKVCGSYAIEVMQVNLRTKENPGHKIQLTLSHEILFRLKLLQEEPAAQSSEITFNTVSELYISDPWRDRYLEEIVLNGKTYRQVLHAYGFSLPGGLAFNELYYGKGVGLIGYTLPSGETYFLQ